MKIFKKLIFLLSIPYSIFGYVKTYYDFKTTDNKRIIIVGDCHEQLPESEEAKYDQAFMSFFDYQEQKKNNTIFLFEGTHATDKNYIASDQEHPMRTIDTSLSKLIPRIANNNNYNLVKFKNADIRSNFIPEISSMLNFINLNVKIDWPGMLPIWSVNDNVFERLDLVKNTKKLHEKIIVDNCNISTANVISYLQHRISMVKNYNYPESVNEIITESIAHLEELLLKIQISTIDIDVNEPICKLLLHNYHIFDIINFIDIKICDLGFFINLLESLHYDTVLLFCGFVHAEAIFNFMQFFLASKGDDFKCNYHKSLDNVYESNTTEIFAFTPEKLNTALKYGKWN